MVSTTDAGLAIVTMFVIGLIVVVLASKLCPTRNAAVLLAMAYLLQVCVTLAIFAQFGLILPDESLYDHLGRSIAGTISSDPSSHLAATKLGWAVVLGNVYRLFGAVPQVGLIFNATLMALVPIAVVRATVELGWARAARPAMFLSCLAPPFLMWGSRLLREGLIFLLVAILFAAAVRCRNQLELGPAFVMIASFVGLYFVRGTATLLISVGLVMGAALAGKVQRERITFAQGMAVAGAMLVIAVGLPVGASHFGWDLDHANTTLIATSRDASSTLYAQGAVPVSTPAAAVMRTVTEFPTALMGPFPWQMSLSGIGVLTAIDAIYWWGLVIAILRGWNLPDSRRGRWLCILPAIAIVMTLTLTTGAFGSIVRYRAMALPFLIPLAAAGLSADRKEKLKRSNSTFRTK